MRCPFSTALSVAAVLMMTCGLPAHLTAAVNVGDRPNIAFQSLQGQRVTSESLAGKLVVVDFWATWCGPCVASMPELIELDRTYRDKGVQVIGVNLDNGPAVVRSFIQARGMSWPQAFEGAQRMSQDWGVTGIPRVFLISPQGEVLWTGHPARMKPEFEKALQTHPPVPPNPKVSDEAIAASTAAIGKAREALDAKDYAGFFAAIADVPEEAVEDRRLLGHARVLQSKLRMHSDTAGLDAAKPSHADAATRLEQLLAPVAPKPLPPGTPAAPASDNGAAAARKLEQAEKQHAAGEYAAAFKAYTWIVERAGETDAATAAAERVAAYEADPAIMEKVRAAASDDKARSALSMARSYETAGKLDLARDGYRKIIANHPGTPAASEAQTRLDAMN